MRKTFFLGVGRWLTAAVIGFFLLRLLFRAGMRTYRLRR